MSALTRVRLTAGVWFEGAHHGVGESIEVDHALARLLVQANRAALVVASETEPVAPERPEVPRGLTTAAFAEPPLVAPSPRRRR